MAFTPLKTNYKDATWSGPKKFRQIENSDGTVSFRDKTSYVNKEDSFFGAKDANAINTAINEIHEKLDITEAEYNHLMQMLED